MKMFLDWNFTKKYSFFLFLSSKVLQNDIKCYQIGFKTSQTCSETFKLSIARRIMHRIIVDQFLSNLKKIHFFTKNPYDAELQKFLPKISQTDPYQKITNVSCLEGCKKTFQGPNLHSVSVQEVLQDQIYPAHFDSLQYDEQKNFGASFKKNCQKRTPDARIESHFSIQRCEI